MADVYVTLEDAAAFEQMPYDTLKKRVQRDQRQYKIRTQPNGKGMAGGTESGRR